MFSKYSIFSRSLAAAPHLWRSLAFMAVTLVTLLIAAPSASAQNMCVGNAVFVDNNNNGHFDIGEGVGSVHVQLWRATQDPNEPYILVTTLQTQASGFYLFQFLDTGTYFIRIPETEFATGAPLAGANSLPGNQFSGDDDTGEDGVDSFDASITGISTMEFNVFPGFGPLNSGTETGFANTVDDNDDSNVDLTIDFGFYRPVGLGNLVFADTNLNGKADANEGIPGVSVLLFHSGDDVTTAPPLADIITSSTGNFYFGGLVAGSYKLYVPPSQFGLGSPLQGALSMTGVGLPGDDDNATVGGHLGDDGIDDAFPAINGIVTGNIVLAAGTEPTGAGTETGSAASDDDSADADSDLTVDLGFVFSPNKVAVGNLVFVDSNTNGVYDDGEGTAGVTVKLFQSGQNPQTDAPVAVCTTRGDGTFLFGDLDQGDYFLHVPKTEFAPSMPLFSAISVTGTNLGDDGTGEKGVDQPYPESSGISTAVFTLTPGLAPTDASNESGYSADSDNFRDSNVDLTRDFGFVLRAASPLSVGNLVFKDNDHDGKFSVGDTGIGDATIQLFHEGDDPLAATPVAFQQTQSNGTYLFAGLTPGRYFVSVPPSQFATGQPMAGFLSSTGNGSDNNVDDDGDENGVDAIDPTVTGVQSIVFELIGGAEPAETGFGHTADDADENNSDLTIDFGFAPNCPVLSISPVSLFQGTRLSPYNATTFELSGGVAPIVWNLSSGTLPAGLTLSPAGVLDGTPTQAGTFNITVQATEDGGCIANHSYTLEIQPAFNLGVGNVVFIDNNGNGHFDSGEGINGVLIQLFHENDDPTTATPVQQQLTFQAGYYGFESLQPGRYFVHLPASQFQSGAPLQDQVSLPGAGADDGKDDDMDENGVDAPNPALAGVSSIVFELAEGTEPADANTETGVNASADNAADSNFDATIDLGFMPSPSTSVGLGNLVYRDGNNNGVFDEGEGLDGVVVQLFNNSDDPLAVAPLRSTITSGGGRYLIRGLVPGTYKVFIPASEFAVSKPLHGLVSMPGAGADAAGDDDSDENGLDTATPSATGISSTPVTLTLGLEPQNGVVETGAANTLDDAADENGDMTVDFGFILDCPSITISPASLSNGQMDANYSVQLGATGVAGPFVYTLAYGTLPPGLSLTSVGLLHGALGTYGSFTFGVKATDVSGCFGLIEYTLEVQAPPLGVGNIIYFDKNNNGHADEGEGVDGVTVQLYDDTQTPGVDSPVASTATAGGGRFLIDNLQPGNYRLHVPKAMFATGAPLWSMKSAPGVLTISDDDSGEDGEDAIDPTASGVHTGLFALAPGSLPQGLAESGLSGASDDARDGNVDLTRDLGFVDTTALPSTFTSWQALHGISGGPTSNGDGDATSDLIEYALGGDPSSGKEPANSCFCVVDNQASNTISVQVRRRHGGTGDLTYTLQVLANLGQSPGSWTATSLTPVITNNGDGTETLNFVGMETDPVFNSTSFGFVRVLVSIDADHNGTPESTQATEVLGWEHRSLSVQHQTYGIAFVAPAVFTGAVDGVSGNTANLTTAAGANSILASMTAGVPYYLEVIGGDNEGQRWEVDEAATTATTIALLPGDALSTTVTVPTNLAGDLVALRPHWLVKDLFPTGDFHATTSPSTADQVVLWNRTNSSYITLWLANAPSGQKWLKVGDATLTNQNNSVVNPMDGLFVRPRVGTVNATASGEVRTWKFACPLKAGLNFVGNPYPVAQSPANRLMTVANGFTGSTNANNADKFNFWNGDASSATSYNVYYLVKTVSVEKWLKVGDATLTDRTNEKLFGAGTAVFVNSKVGQSNWIMPVPWTP